jgi:hypothetical protein
MSEWPLDGKMCLNSNWISHANGDHLAACFGGLLCWLLLPGVCGRKGRELQFTRIIRHFVQNRVVFSLKDWVKNIVGRKMQGLGGVCCKIKTGRIRWFFLSGELPFFSIS